MNHFDLWIANLRQRHSVSLAQPITVVGNRKRPLGPHSEFAKVVMTIGPADELDVVDKSPVEKNSNALEWRGLSASFSDC